MSELNPFDSRLAGLIAKLSPQSRKSLAVAVSKRLRASQQQNIKHQQAPDGTPYAQRKTSQRSKKRLRDRAMFSKLRTARYLKPRATAMRPWLSCRAGSAYGQCASFGLRDRPTPHSEAVKYEARPLLGLARMTSKS